jgi:hypothetical protein
VAGRDVMRDGVVQTMDEDDVRARARREAERLWKRGCCG